MDIMIGVITSMLQKVHPWGKCKCIINQDGLFASWKELSTLLPITGTFLVLPSPSVWQSYALHQQHTSSQDRTQIPSFLCSRFWPQSPRESVSSRRLNSSCSHSFCQCMFWKFLSCGSLLPPRKPFSVWHYKRESSSGLLFLFFPLGIFLKSSQGPHNTVVLVAMMLILFANCWGRREAGQGLVLIYRGILKVTSATFQQVAACTVEATRASFLLCSALIKLVKFKKDLPLNNSW